MNRQEGYYWVKMTDSIGWEVAKWSCGSWSIFDGVMSCVSDAEMLEINESRILSPDEISQGVHVDHFIDKDTKQHVVYAPQLKVSGYGETEDKAIEMLKFCIQSATAD